MKTILAFLLTLIMLVPTCSASGENAPVLNRADDIRAMLNALPEAMSTNDMVERGFCVYVHGVYEPGSRELLDRFLDSAQAGGSCEIVIATYTDEGDPILNYVSFDGNSYHYANDMSRDMYAGNGDRLSTAEYKYLTQFDGPYGREIVLTNREALTYTQLCSDQSSMESVILLMDYSESKVRGLFDYKLLPALYMQYGQFAFSPMSLEIALAMVAEGAAGETHQQLLNFMDTDRLRERDFSRYPELKVANAAIVSNQVALLDSYQNMLANKYLAQVLPMEHDVVQQVNAWANEHTDGMIPDFLDEQPSDFLRLVLLNALALDAKWVVPFDPAWTADGDFYASDHNVSVPFMRRSGSFAYVEVDGVQAVKLPYADGPLELLVILPEQDGLERVLNRLGAEGNSWLGEFRWVDTVSLSLPKFSMQSDLNLKELLQGMGLVLPFEAQTNFSAMTGKGDLFIGEIIQKVRIDVDEEGTRAAAVTEIEMMDGAAPPTDIVDMIVNRPYILLLQDEGQATPFVAVVTDPSKT